MDAVVTRVGEFGYISRGTGPPVLMIHGSGTAADLWSEDLRFLADRYRVIVYNRRGFEGSAAAPRDWSAHTRDAAAVMEALGIVPATVMGHSGGAAVALDLAATHPETISNLVLLDPAFEPRKHLTPRLALAFVRTQVARRRHGGEAAAAVWLRYVIGYAAGGSAWDSPEMPDDRRRRILRNAAGILADTDADENRDFSAERLARISCPVSIVDAELSQPFLRKGAATLHERLPRARRETIEGAGHAIFFEKPAEFRAAIEEALHRGKKDEGRPLGRPSQAALE